MTPRVMASLSRRAAKTCSFISPRSRWTPSRPLLRARKSSSRSRPETRGCTPPTSSASEIDTPASAYRLCLRPPLTPAGGGVFTPRAIRVARHASNARHASPLRRAAPERTSHDAAYGSGTTPAARANTTLLLILGAVVSRPQAASCRPRSGRRGSLVQSRQHDAPRIVFHHEHHASSVSAPLPRRRLRAHLSRVLRPHLAPAHHRARREHVRGVGHRQLPQSPRHHPQARLPRLGARQRALVPPRDVPRVQGDATEALR